jgi:hypothetical protein
MAALDLAIRHVHNVPEQSAKRRPQHMHDLETGRRGRRVSLLARRHKRRRGPSIGAAEWHTGESSVDRARITHARIP